MHELNCSGGFSAALWTKRLEAFVFLICTISKIYCSMLVYLGLTCTDFKFLNMLVVFLNGSESAIECGL